MPRLSVIMATSNMTVALIRILIVCAAVASSIASQKAFGLTDDFRRMEGQARKQLLRIAEHEVDVIDHPKSFNADEIRYIRTREGLAEKFDDTFVLNFYLGELSVERVKQQTRTAQAFARSILSEYELPITDQAVRAVANSLPPRDQPFPLSEPRSIHRIPFTWLPTDQPLPFTKAQTETIILVYVELEKLKAIHEKSFADVMEGDPSFYQRLMKSGLNQNLAEKIAKIAKQTFIKGALSIENKLRCCGKWRREPACGPCPLNKDRIEENRAALKDELEKNPCLKSLSPIPTSPAPARLLLYQKPL